jgi:hypothetical protein
LIRQNRSLISLLGVIIVIGSVLVITASGGLLSQKGGINSLLSPGALITLQINSVNTQIPITYQSNTPGKLSYTENSTACGYCDGNPYSPSYSDNPFVTPNLTPYYPPKFWNYPPPGFMPLVPHTDPALYYSETSSAAGMTNGFDKKTGFLLP